MPVIDLAFQIVGTTIPLDHGYPLFSAICRLVPVLHGDRRIGVHPIRGRQSAPGVLRLHEGSRLRLRLPSEDVAAYIPLAGAELELDGHRLRVGIPNVEALKPAESLGSRLVTYRHGLDPVAVEACVRRELAGLEITAEPRLISSARPPWTGQPMRRVVTIAGRRVVGFSLRVSGLTPRESLRFQDHGLGGRRRFGCGVLTPVTVTMLDTPTK
jgi:CRISPR-associated protein Cas6